MKNSLALTAGCAALIGALTPVSAEEVVVNVAIRGKEIGAKAKQHAATAVYIGDQMLVLGLAGKGRVEGFEAKVGGKPVAAKLVGYDVSTQLAYLQLPAAAASGLKKTKIGVSSSLVAGDALTVGKGGKNSAVYVGREGRYGGQVMPFALLRVHQSADAPQLAEKSMLYNASGSLVGLVHTKIGTEGYANYAVPAEVIERGAEDLSSNKKIARAWVGVVLDATNVSAIVTSVRPDSPAAKAGFKKGDIIIKIGDRAISNYDDAVNAFYYIISGQEVPFRVLRRDKLVDIKVAAGSFPTAEAKNVAKP